MWELLNTHYLQKIDCKGFLNLIWNTVSPAFTITECVTHSITLKVRFTFIIDGFCFFLTIIFKIEYHSILGSPSS